MSCLTSWSIRIMNRYRPSGCPGRGPGRVRGPAPGAGAGRGDRPGSDCRVAVEAGVPLIFSFQSAFSLCRTYMPMREIAKTRVLTNCGLDRPAIVGSLSYSFLRNSKKKRETEYRRSRIQVSWPSYCLCFLSMSDNRNRINRLRDMYRGRG